jgi:16S rRNA processing protein RimM
VVGRIGRPHGIRGEVTVVPEDPASFVPGATFTTGAGGTLTVAAVRPLRDRGLVVAFEGVGDRNAAETLRGETLQAVVRRRLEAGEWWIEDLLGLRAVDGAGEVLGEVTGLVPGSAQDRLVVTTPGGTEVEIPFVDDLVDDPADGVILMRPPVGLFPE